MNSRIFIVPYNRKCLKVINYMYSFNVLFWHKQQQKLETRKIKKSHLIALIWIYFLLSVTGSSPAAEKLYHSTTRGNIAHFISHLCAFTLHIITPISLFTCLPHPPFSTFSVYLYFTSSSTTLTFSNLQTTLFSSK